MIILSTESEELCCDEGFCVRRRRDPEVVNGENGVNGFRVNGNGNANGSANGVSSVNSVNGDYATNGVNGVNGHAPSTEPVERYRPAYELVDGSLERAGRASSVGTATNVVPASS